MMDFILLNYFVLLLIIAIFRGKLITSLSTYSTPTIDIVVPFRNEGVKPYKQASQLIKSPPDIHAIIYVNDHSSDEGAPLLKSLNNARLIVLDAELEGKKNALSIGIEAASSEWIILLDADVVLPENWIQNAIRFIGNTSADVLLFPVRITESSILEQLDFLSLQATTAAFANLNSPILANGAALAIKRTIRIAANSKLRPDIASGDDVFLVHEAHKNKHKVVFVQQKEAIVETNGNTSFTALLNQRIRWGAKSIHFTSKSAWYVSLSVLLFSIIWTVCPALVAVDVISPYYFFTCIGIKLILDACILIPTAIHYNQKNLIPHILWLSPLHPLFLVFTAIAGFVVKPIWKDRPA